LSPLPLLAEARRSFHASLLENVLRAPGGVPTNADKNSVMSVELASRVLARLGREAAGARMAGQMSGRAFERAVEDYLRLTFPMFSHLRPGRWEIRQGNARISDFEQYEHIAHVRAASRTDPELAAAIGSDYYIKPDVVILRHPETDETINANSEILGPDVAERASLRLRGEGRPLLHASISCKWTIRSDRAQNARAEALNLIRTRKGRVPHIVTVTAEPLPSRIASLALGTGDLDVVYHFALSELLESAQECVEQRPAAEETLSLLRMMVEGKRLKDISDLPLDLAV
jgi:hypothetical protein